MPESYGFFFQRTKRMAHGFECWVKNITISKNPSTREKDSGYRVEVPTVAAH
jgi:hypothetical protein